MLNLYCCFHLNLSYSAIEEEQRRQVVERCYWPLLRLVDRLKMPIGIELTGSTLEQIEELDPVWISSLRDLMTQGLCELIGSGYAQLISPLVPAMVTQANLRIGNRVYEKILGVTPNIALINEQVYSAGLVPLYLDARYQAIVMEWNNPAKSHTNWDSEWRYYPQRAVGVGGETIPIIWNHSIGFQKFQRYVHGEMELNEMVEYLLSHDGGVDRFFPLYGNDAEIFDYRPGRYMTEAPLHTDGEWERIAMLCDSLKRHQSVDFLLPSQVLGGLEVASGGHCLQLESAEQPIPVKKQQKYNPTRWAVTGRDDLNINTRCWKIYELLRHDVRTTDEDWRGLCSLWSSDFRTHITKERWRRYHLNLLDRFDRLVAYKMDRTSSPEVLSHHAPRQLSIHRKGRYLEIHGSRIQVRLNCLKGLALDSFIDHHYDDRPVCGTLDHGYFDDIHYGADYYSGHLVFEAPGRSKITDLNRVEPVWHSDEKSALVTGLIETPLGTIEKSWLVNDERGEIELRFKLEWKKRLVGSMRLGYLTLIPGLFDPAKMRYWTHNGGELMEEFEIGRHSFDHSRAVSFLVSANQLIGVTEGVVELGDSNHRLRLRFDKSEAALVGMVSNGLVGERHFTRLALSAREMDDTSKPSPIGPLDVGITLSVVATAVAGE